ncbi:DUF4167 domain-containing protein [Alkalilacustris brevis]|uniref:DUF4167 domain-containing protein n=1 Tax=Alkalilacustris brevis TaxID=2026338 RepID=UPI000E0CF492|nr:DUF4167 domain-containing protein [Alkalilacustris brevis]
MRSSKSRSRSKSNRPRPLGNVINRVFDSSGPDGKVRGTPQQIIDKYLVLARDAQLANDRVAAENFLQHAEHYTRVLAEAQAEVNREAEARREAQEAQARQQQESQARRTTQGRGEGDGGEGRGGHEGRNARENRNGDQRHTGADGAQGQDAPGVSGGNDSKTSQKGADDEAPRGSAAVIEFEAEPDSGLVETPESRRKKPARKPRAAGNAAGGDAAGDDSNTGDDKPAPKRRSPRKPKPAPEAGQETQTRSSEEQNT